MVRRLGFVTASLLAANIAASGTAVAEPPLPKAVASANLGATAPVAERMTVVADRDDDDADGTADAENAMLAPLARQDLVTLDARWAGATFDPATGAETVRIVASGKPLSWGERIPAGAQVQGIAAGRALLVAHWGRREARLAIDVHGVGFRNGKNVLVDATRNHASLERTPPARVDLEDATEVIDDPDALRLTINSPDGAALGGVSVESVSAEGVAIDSLKNVPMRSVPCENDEQSCLASAPLRFVVDDVDRVHPLIAQRSLRAEVGGAIVVRDSAGKKLQAIRVAGPDGIGRYRLAVRPIVMRVEKGLGPSVGGTDLGAIAAIRQELAAASATWGQCGVTFGPTAQLDVKVVNPPPPYLVALGDDIGLPASGGDVKLKIEGRIVAFKTQKGWSTRQAGLELQRAAQRLGFKATISENARIASGASPSVDVAMSRSDGQLASVEVVSSSDATMAVRVGSVDLAGGLHHFGDTDSVAGTLEERTLVKAIDDGDPHTIEVLIVPFFSGGGRIGESFISSDGSSMRNVVIVDRAGIRARRTSLTLAHELGHVILDEPGHPDDFGIDTPTLLMDSDASDASPFGPRRLTQDECTRAIRQSGPNGKVPLLSEWKLGPIRYGR